MAKVDGLPINFVFSEAARLAIADLRRDWDSRFSDKAGPVTISWGYFQQQSKTIGGGVIVSFYGQSDVPEIKAAIERHAGMEVVFYVSKETHYNFERKVLDYSEENWFFLR